MKKCVIMLLTLISVLAMTFAVACTQTTTDTSSGSASGHNWSSAWSMDETNHWHDCTDSGCSEKSDLAAHSDADADGLCDVCGYTMGSQTVENSVTLYYYNTEGWQDVYAYAVTDGGEELLGEMPGTQTAATDRSNWVSITVNANPMTDSFSISFNNNSSGSDLQETPEIVIDDTTDIYLINKANGSYSSYDAAEEAAETSTVVVKDTITIHYHKNDSWGDTVKAYAYYSDGDTQPLGGWGEYTAASEGDSWYKITVSLEEGRISNGGFNLIIYDGEAETSRVEPVITVTECWVAADGQIFDSKEAVITYESAETMVYTICYYAPEWTDGESVYVYTYGGTLGSIGGYNSVIMIADTENTGAYTVSFETSLDVTSFSVIFHTYDESIKHEFYVDSLTGTAFWFVANGNDVYYSYADAKTAYEYNAALDESEIISVTLYFYAPEWSDVKIHIYNAYETGTWGTVSMTADSTNTGWYTYTFEVASLALTEKGINIIFFDSNETVRVETYTNSAQWVYFNAAKGNDNCYGSMADALAEDTAEGANEYTLYLYAPAATGSVTISTWGNMAGEFADNSVMTAVDGSTGWYSYTFKTDLDIANGANFNFYIDGTYTTGGYTTDASWVYFVSGLNDTKYGSMADAVAAYDAANTESGGDESGEQVETITVTFYLYAPDWSDVKIHTWNAYVTGDWGTVSMTADSENTGWYTYTFECDKSAFETDGVNVIFFDGTDDTQRVTTYTKDSAWVYFNAANGDNNCYGSMADALA